jgi:hypothetical protein
LPLRGLVTRRAHVFGIRSVYFRTSVKDALTRFVLWHPDLLWFRDSPTAGEPGCRCSWCNEPIDTEAECLRMWYGERQRYELRFHPLCFAYVATVEGLLFTDIEAMMAQWHYGHCAQ